MNPIPAIMLAILILLAIAVLYKYRVWAINRPQARKPIHTPPAEEHYRALEAALAAGKVVQLCAIDQFGVAVRWHRVEAITRNWHPDRYRILDDKQADMQGLTPIPGYPNVAERADGTPVYVGPDDADKEDIISKCVGVLPDSVQRELDPVTLKAAREYMQQKVANTTPHITTDPTDPRLGHGVDKEPAPQNEVYLVLSEEERAKGFVRPVRHAYMHVGRTGRPTEPSDGACGCTTTMGLSLCETYARDPKFYGSTYCCTCRKHLPVAEFKWLENNGSLGPVVGS